MVLTQATYIPGEIEQDIASYACGCASTIIHNNIEDILYNEKSPLSALFSVGHVHNSCYSISEMKPAKFMQVPCNETKFHPVNPCERVRMSEVKHYTLAQQILETFSCSMSQPLNEWITRTINQANISINQILESEIIKSLNDKITVRDITHCGNYCDSIYTITPDDDKVINIDATKGFTGNVMAQIRNAFAQDQLYGAPGNNDIVLILPHAAIEQWRSSVGTNGCCVSDEIDRGYFYRINGIDIWTPKLTTTSFLQGTYPVKQNDGSTANITGVVAYAVIKSGLEFTYLNAFSDFAKQAGYLSDAYYSGLNSEYTPLVRVTGGRKLVQNLDMPGFVLAAQTSFGIMRNRPNVVVRILLPTNILDYTAAAIVPPAPAPLSSIPASPISPTSRSTRAKTIANKITEDVTTASENIATDNTIAE